MNDFFSLLGNFKFLDLLDIFILSLILYRFFSTIQGTRAVQVLVGTATIATLYWLSLSFELYSLNWLLENFFEYFFIILIILFQEQIRTSLAVFGNTSWFSKKKKSYYDTQIEEIISACSRLSFEKTGALIVVEGKYGLLNFAQTGTKIESRVHADLLHAIFQPSSSLHDGAVIILKDRVQAAGCFLPLSKSAEVKREHGTRHRAALGISEVSDAFVVLVSEESGSITVCLGGKFIRCENENELRSQMRIYLYSAKENLGLVERLTA